MCDSSNDLLVALMGSKEEGDPLSRGREGRRAPLSLIFPVPEDRYVSPSPRNRGRSVDQCPAEATFVLLPKLITLQKLAKMANH